MRHIYLYFTTQSPNIASPGREHPDKHNNNKISSSLIICQLGHIKPEFRLLLLNITFIRVYGSSYEGMYVKVAGQSLFELAVTSVLSELQILRHPVPRSHQYWWVCTKTHWEAAGKACPLRDSSLCVSQRNLQRLHNFF